MNRGSAKAWAPAGGRRASSLRAPVSSLVFVEVGFIPLALIATWSFWSFDPDTTT